jgi:Uma2 family endonuclease
MVRVSVSAGKWAWYNVATMSLDTEPRRLVTTRRYQNAREWLHDLGDIPLERIIFDPWPGTATVEDVVYYLERKGALCELLNGVLVEKTMGYWEGVIALTIGRILGNFVEENELGIVTGPDSTMRMRSGNVLMPDVGFTSLSRVPRTRTAVPDTSPDLAIEVLSPSNTERETKKKLHEYFSTGTRMVWIVDPADRTIAVFTQPDLADAILGESDTITGGDVLPGFTCKVERLFNHVPRDLSEPSP